MDAMDGARQPSGVVQMAERWTHNPQVAGSSPVPATTNGKLQRKENRDEMQDLMVDGKAMSTDEMAFQGRENTKDIHGLKLAVYGDNNGNRGIIRRVDDIEHQTKFIKKQNWVIIAMLLGLYVEFIKSLLGN